MDGNPIDGNAVVLAAAKASVSGERLPALLDRAQAHLGPRRPEYARRYECVHEDGVAVFLVETGHWAGVGDRMDVDEREWRALRRAHREHLKRLGGELGRGEEFGTALEVREAVVIGSSEEQEEQDRPDEPQ